MNKTEHSLGGQKAALWGAKSPTADTSTDPLFMKQGGQYYWYHNDHLKTPQVMTTSSGAVVWKAKYSSFGKATVDPSSTVDNPLRLPGQYEDAETGLHYNWFRYYSPDTGRYISTDPIGFLGGLNLFRYAANNPLNTYDPFGLLVAGGAVITVTAEAVGLPATAIGGSVVFAAAAVGYGSYQITSWLIKDTWLDGGIGELIYDMTHDSDGDDNSPRARSRDFTDQVRNNPDSQKCRSLARKIENLREEIFGKRIPDLENNPCNLPERIGPGEQLRDTIRGHRKLLHRQLRRLRELEKRYDKECK